MKLISTLTCPLCGHQATKTMSVDACLRVYECKRCRALQKPKAGDCYAFCSYGDTPCPSIQAEAAGRGVVEEGESGMRFYAHSGDNGRNSCEGEEFSLGKTTRPISCCLFLLASLFCLPFWSRFKSVSPLRRLRRAAAISFWAEFSVDPLRTLLKTKAA